MTECSSIHFFDNLMDVGINNGVKRKTQFFLHCGDGFSKQLNKG